MATLLFVGGTARRRLSKMPVSHRHEQLSRVVCGAWCVESYCMRVHIICHSADTKVLGNTIVQSTQSSASGVIASAHRISTQGGVP